MKTNIKLAPASTYIFKSFLLLSLLVLTSCFSPPSERTDYRGDARVPHGQLQGQSNGQLNGQAPQSYPQLSTEQLNQQLLNAAPEEISGETVKIALFIPLSGKANKIGTAFLDAAKLGVFTEGSSNVQILPYDTKGTAEGAVAAMDAAMQNRPDVIIGPLFSDEVKAVAPLARANNIKVLAFSNNKKVAGNDVYLLGLRPDQQIERLINYSARRGISSFAASIPLNLLGNEIKSSLKQSVQNNGKQLSFTQDYPVFSTPDYSKVADEISTQFGDYPDLNNGQYALVLPESGAELKRFLLSLGQNNISTKNVRFLGLESWDNPETYTIPELDGAWYTSVPYQNMNSFMVNFNENFGYRPPQLASLAYDAVLLAAELGKNGLMSGQILRPDGFYGVNGAYRFSPSGLSERKYDIIEINYGKITILDSAPSFF
jgi:ABC-type branched-subunit amino acid transport system substrate-binding protein